MVRNLKEGQFDKYTSRINDITKGVDIKGDVNVIRKEVSKRLDNLVYDIIDDYNLPLDTFHSLRPKFDSIVDDFINNLKTVRKNRASALAKVGGTTLHTEIKNWYLDNYPEDDLGFEIGNSVGKPDIDFQELLDALDDGDKETVYSCYADDSVVRERVFAELAELLNVSYDTIYDKWMKVMNMSESYLHESNYGYTQNGDEIDESTVDELYRVAEYELLPDSELARVFGIDNISIDEDTFDYTAIGTAFGAYICYDIIIHVATGSYGNNFNLNNFINPNYDELHPDFDIKDVAFDIIVHVDGDKATATVDLNPRTIRIEDDATDYYAKKFSRMLDIDAIEQDVETIAERDAYEIKSVLSNI